MFSLFIWYLAKMKARLQLWHFHRYDAGKYDQIDRRYAGRTICSVSNTSSALMDLVYSGQPFMAARFGANEICVTAKI